MRSDHFQYFRTGIALFGWLSLTLHCLHVVLRQQVRSYTCTLPKLPPTG